YTQVTSVKENPDGRVFVGCDTGFNHLIRPCMYDSYHHIDNCTHPDNTAQVCDIVGNICESGDIFARQRSIPKAELNDILAIRDAGAYGMSMASTYNMRPLPAEIIIDGDTHSVAREAQSYEQLFTAWNF
ncbi:MAG: diaminopimelate decarboxylase, partial [Planctomycetes bacterium]|nr:diaminopimelate decarboxylase [Planctomycetota bacterium]